MENLMDQLSGERHTFSQENGDDLPLLVFGDANYARYVTEQGFTAIYDNRRGLYCYALVKRGKFVSSGIPVTQPPPPGLQPDLREADTVRLAKIAAIIEARTAPGE